MIRPLHLLVPSALAAASLVVVVRPAEAAPEPTKVWEQQIAGGAIRESSPLLVDVDGDGTLDITFGTQQSRVHVLRGTDGSAVPGWPQTTSNRINSSASAADVDGDGRPELYIGAGVDGEAQPGQAGGALYSFDHDGNTRFRRVLPDKVFTRGAAVHATPALGDLDNDGGIDAFAGTLGLESAWSVHPDGAPRPGSPFYWDDTIFSSAALHDVNGDGRVDAIVGGDSSPGAPVDHRGGMVRALSGTGQSLWEYRMNDIVRSSPSVGDIDGDGKVEVVFGAGDFWHGSDATAVVALDAATGRQKWKRSTDGVTNGSPALADVNGDGRLDVVIGTFNSETPARPGGSVYALSGTDGSDLSGFPKASGGGAVLGAIVTADVDGDGAQDPIVTTGAYIAVFSGKTGAKLFNLAEGQSVSFQNAAAVADVDGNGRIDIIAAGTKATAEVGVIYRWELPAEARLGKLGWHQFRKDTRRTGSWTSGVPNASTIPFTRTAGADRYATAVMLSEKVPSGVNTVYVATGTAFADALAGGPAAAAAKSAVLLVSRDEVPSATRARLQQLTPRQIRVLGGPAAVSDSVLAQLNGLAREGAVRVAGENRFATAAAVSAGAFQPLAPVAYIATGGAFPDALAGAAAAALQGGPVLLVEPNAIPGPTSTELRRLLPRAIVILGGTSAVSQAVEQELRAYTPGSITRAAGSGRYDTAVQVSKATYPNGAASAFIATGVNFPDALAGGPVAAAAKAPLLLVPGRCLPGVVRAELDRLGVTSLVLLGGDGAVGSSIGSLTPC